MPQTIVKIGHPLLRAVIGPSGRGRSLKTVQTLIPEMVKTMRRAQGVGLAANQIGKNFRLFVMECRGNERYPRVESFPLQAYLNIKIVRYSKATEKGWEGCLSVPGFRGIVSRSKNIWVEALTPEGKKVRKFFSGFEARVIQHETDHLNGLIYMDRMGDLKSWTHLEEFNRKRRKSIKD